MQRRRHEAGTQCAPKQSDLDPLPTWLLKDRIELLSPYITHLIKHISVDRQRA